MTPTEILTIAGLAAGIAALVWVLVSNRITGNAMLAAMLSAGFAAFTAVQIWQDGIVMFWTNHTANLTGVQVWWDLIMCVTIALFLIAPRARKAGMNVLPWALFVACTASIGLLAMCARLFWLEKAAAEKTAA
ncbi:hypothetical protein [Qipengyuania sp. ASV99]|uniref:hypothetical protein n=1 Tax=Qipengyuania sp. ASV99 TaxID=3399681 RepID=UPI003A4C6E6A